VVVGLSLATLSGQAAAESTIKRPGQHPRYPLELEPHLLLGPFNPPGPGDGDGYGIGARLSIPIVHDGFLAKLNDSIAITFGADWVRYESDNRYRGRCTETVSGPNGTPICVEIDGGGGGDWDYLHFPLAMQWNFWLTDQLSAFGEPGFSLHWVADDGVAISPAVLYVGGRWHFTKTAALTLRLGYPTLSAGVSFLF
jgi:hypothetical protein